MKVSKECLKRNLYLPQTLLFQTGQLSAIRMGFGNLNDNEIERSMEVLVEAVKANS